MTEGNKPQLTEADLLRMSLSLDREAEKLAQMWGISVVGRGSQPLKKTTLPGGINSNSLGREHITDPKKGPIEPERSKSSPSPLLDMGR